MITLSSVSLRLQFASDFIRTSPLSMSLEQLNLAAALLLGLNIRVIDVRTMIFEVDIDRSSRSFCPTTNAADFIYLIERISISTSIDAKAGREKLPDFMNRERFTAWFDHEPNTRHQSSSEGIQITVARSCAKLLSINIRRFGDCTERA